MMMKRLALGLLLLIAACVQAQAVCVNPIDFKDAGGTTRGFATTVDGSGNCVGLQAIPGVAITTLSGWTSGTAADTTQALMTTTGAPALIVQLVQTSTISGGAVTFEGTFDGTNWVSIPIAQVLHPNTFNSLSNPYTLVASTNQPFLILTSGYRSVRIRLSTQITGSATVTPHVTLLAHNPTIGGIINPVTGTVAISQASPASSNAVQSIPGTAGGLSQTSFLSVNNTTGVNIKASAGMLFGVEVYSISATPAYLKLYNTAGTPTCGSGTPTRRVLIPASTSGAGAVRSITLGVAFGTGIAYCLTTGIADNDTTAPAANVYIVNIDWK